MPSVSPAKAVLVSVLALAGVGAVVYFAIPSARDAAEGLQRVETREVTGPAAELAADGDAVALSAANTKIGFAGTKTVAGKQVVVRGGWSGAFDGEIDGRIVLDPATGQPAGVEANVVVASLWSEHDDLTNALLTQGFFQTEQNPTARFVSTSVSADVPAGTELEGATHVVTGNFTLNGVTREIAFPIRLDDADGRLALRSEFALPRHDFNVAFADSAVFGLLTDDDIADLVAVTVDVDTEATPNAATAVADSDEPEAEPDAEPIDIAALPRQFQETIDASQVQFDMILVPGDDEVGPLYVAETETTWAAFFPWVMGVDLGDAIAEARAMELRPSAPYGAVDRGFGMGDRPALSMSKLAAQLYCEWLSDQTGRRYRLPTEAEWQHIFEAGGAVTKNGVSSANSWDDLIGDQVTRETAKTFADNNGIRGLAGNVAEWVTDTGDENVARGGHFDASSSELGTGRHVEDQDVWNRDYPNDPKSIWWFVNARWVGFRVVCEPSANVPNTATTPEPTASLRRP